MGDHAAVDIAQESHVNVLRSHGCLCLKKQCATAVPWLLRPVRFMRVLLLTITWECSLCRGMAEKGYP
jgi:hypothetical protein